jgi:hypothetical protein
MLRILRPPPRMRRESAQRAIRALMSKSSRRRCMRLALGSGVLMRMGEMRASLSARWRELCSACVGEEGDRRGAPQRAAAEGPSVATRGGHRRRAQ